MVTTAAFVPGVKASRLHRIMARQVGVASASGYFHAKETHPKLRAEPIGRASGFEITRLGGPIGYKAKDDNEAC